MTLTELLTVPVNPGKFQFGDVQHKSSAKLEGNLTAAALSMEEGASITGSFKVTEKENR